jgi:hypothetical protein
LSALSIALFACPHASRASAHHRQRVQNDISLKSSVFGALPPIAYEQVKFGPKHQLSCREQQLDTVIYELTALLARKVLI